MESTTRPKRLLMAAFVAAAAALSAQAASAGPTTPEVPETIAVVEGHKPFLAGHAVGVQIYSCNGVAWSLVAPRANLYDDNGAHIMKHYGGPTWEATDGSKVVGRAEAKVTVDPTAIPWLRLAATSTSVGPDGDRLAGTTYIQRIETGGGLAPSASRCKRKTAGTVVEVPYTADYYFWKQTAA
jgi:hypothetical protein